MDASMPDQDEPMADDGLPQLPAALGSGASVENLPYQLEVETDTSSDSHSEPSPADLRNFDDTSTSVRSSIYNFPIENGRSYHAYKSGKYFLPNDATEQERLDLQHHTAMILLDGRLNLAPLQNPKRVLDIGTGTGIWVIEFAKQNEDTLVIGSDLSPIQPDYVPANCRFEIGDAEEEDWGYDTPFDYIHMRAMVTCFKNAQPVIQRVFQNLAPGGYFESQDGCLPFRCNDNSMAGTALERWNGLFVEACRRVGKDLGDNLNWGRYMREAGFEDVVEQRGAMALNTWPKGAKNKLLGALTLQNTLEGVDSMSRALFTRVMGWSNEEFGSFLEEVKNDLRNKKIHAYVEVYFVYGRKPASSKEDIEM